MERNLRELHTGKFSHAVTSVPPILNLSTGDGDERLISRPGRIYWWKRGLTINRRLCGFQSRYLQSCIDKISALVEKSNLKFLGHIACSVITILSYFEQISGCKKP